MTAPDLRPVRRRIVLYAPGFERLRPEEHRDRFARTLTRTAAVWSIDAEATPLVPSAGDALPTFSARASGPDWRTEAEIHLLAWDDLLRAELGRDALARLGRGTAALGRILLGGTLARYAAAHWRYGLFALYPMSLLLAIVAAGAAAGLVAGGGAAGVGLAAAVLAGLMASARSVLHLDLLLADWAFARDLARHQTASHAVRVRRFADEILAAARRADADEILLVGHSLGAVFAVMALAEALRRDRALLGRSRRFALLGLGSSVLKIALDPAAERLRTDLAQLATAPVLVWVDYPSRRDVLSFERSEPIEHLGLPGRGPRLESVHPRDMVDAAHWSRMRWNFLRIHRQYVMGNGRRYFLDFGLLLCGPLPAGAGLRPDRLLGIDGALGCAAAPPRPAVGVR
jgi:hypothetical protein